MSVSVANMTTNISSMSFLRINAARKLLRLDTRTGRSLPWGSTAFLSSVKDLSSNDEENLSLTLDDYEIMMEEKQESEKLEELQNISGLSPEQYNLYHGKPPVLPFKDLDRRRKLFARYGLASGEDPRIMWPPKQELLDMIEHEKAEEIPLLDKLAKLQADRDAAERERLERHKMIEKNMAQMSKWIAEYQVKVRDAEEQIRMKQDKKQAMLDEARDYFGYKIRANDPKFQQMMEEKEAQEKKELRERKKKERAKKLAERLKQDEMLMGLDPNSDKTS